MSLAEEILSQYEQFANYLEQVDLKALQSNMSRQELNELKSKLYGVKIRSLPNEIGKITELMKQEEFPELLGVHHYPALRDIDFMSESKKVELDTFLSGHRVGNYVQSLWRFCEDADRLMQFLVDKEIVKKVYFVTCPRHNGSMLTSKLSLEEFEKIKTAIETKDYETLYAMFDDTLMTYCDECEAQVLDEESEWRDSMKREAYMLIQGRDTSLDRA